VKDNRMKDRVDGLIVDRPTEQPKTAADDAGQSLTVHMLTLAQRTAEKHIAGAHQEADKIQAEAQATAEQIVRDAMARATVELREAEEARSRAHAEAEQMARDAEARADHARRTAQIIMSEARARAEQIAADAQAQADELDGRAQMRHDDLVVSLAAKQQAVQQQVQTLEQFDREYRARLVTFMRTQLRTLGVDAQVESGVAQRGSAASQESEPPPQ
jgi:hypothetical protein